MDLKKYGITYEGVEFRVSKDKQGEKNMLMRAQTFQEFIEIVRPFSLKAAYLMLIYKHLNLSHRPYLVRTFNELSNELGTEFRVLKRYSKSLKEDGLLVYSKLSPEDASISDQYIFSMGPKFSKWMWKSKIFDLVKSDHGGDKVGNIGDNYQQINVEVVHNEPPETAKGSTADHQMNHYGPPEKSQHTENIEESNSPNIPVFSSSSIYMSSVSEKLPNGLEKGKLNPIRLQIKWLEETGGEDPAAFEEWRKTSNL